MDSKDLNIFGLYGLSKDVNISYSDSDLDKYQEH